MVLACVYPAEAEADGISVPALRLLLVERSMLDVHTFEAAFRQASPRLLAIALAMCRNRDAAHDLVQEAGLIAWKKRDQFAEGTNFSAWSGQIVRNLALRHLRDAGRRSSALLEEPAASGSRTGDVGLGQADISARDVQASRAYDRGGLGDWLGVDDSMASALSDLAEEARTCFLLRSMCQLSYDEIASTLNIAPGTAMSHVHRSRKRVLLRLSDAAGASPARPDKRGEARATSPVTSIWTRSTATWTA